MKIAFYAPFKPLDHPNPSGDQMLAKGLFQSLKDQGHTPEVISSLRCRWIYWHPAKKLQAISEITRITELLRKKPVDCWLTYHCYYKSPDIIGPEVTRRLAIPYVIYQGSYATKYRRQIATKPGFSLARKALKQADLHLSDRKSDTHNLQRIVPSGKLQVVQPGITPEQFFFDEQSRQQLRSKWQVENPVLFTAAMMREDVKSKGIEWVIDCCASLLKQGYDFTLVIAGDGPAKERLAAYASSLLRDRVLFLGKVAREKMYQYYSAADIFVFPGFNESLGMVFLEAQSCGLPVVACANGGVPEVVCDGKSGLLSPVDEQAAFTNNIQTLLDNKLLREEMGVFGAIHVRAHHDRTINYNMLGNMLNNAVKKYTNG